MTLTVQTAPLKLQIAAEIKRRIIHAQLAFGQKISENSLAAELGTKRMPVREAFLILESDNWLTIVPQKGTYVMTFTAGEIRQLGEYRSVLESASLAAIHESRERGAFVAELSAILEEHENALRRNDIHACERCDTLFHERIIAFSRNAYLVASYSIIADKAKAIRYRTLQSLERFSGVLRDHHEILSALAAGEMEFCSRTLKRHIDNTLNIVLLNPVLYAKICLPGA